ncbi:hypothetical protein B9Z55_023771 [Caenorhabditis nigoni]|uniref:Uncharacterized protein n=1 Tax=Caenorhabditis nigoni TaxID=1611254 RepID=A0A2G5SR31_9PELO|nr:hypothetical protein B9Z55_023771 [Caenorhabditis nigoni]
MEKSLIVEKMYTIYNQNHKYSDEKQAYSDVRQNKSLKPNPQKNREKPSNQACAATNCRLPKLPKLPNFCCRFAVAEIGN